MDITVFEVTNPEALDIPEFSVFLRRAVEAYPFLTVPVDDALPELQNFVTASNIRMLVAAEGKEFKALAILVIDVDQFSPVPQVAHFFNEGRATTKRKLVEKVVDIVKEKGYNRFWAVNATEAANSVWARSFRRAGKCKTIGSIMEFEI